MIFNNVLVAFQNSTFFLVLFFRAAPVVYGSCRLGVQSKLQQLAYTTATEMQDPSTTFNLYHSSRQRQILNPLTEARDGTCVLMDTSWVLFH